MLHFVRTYVRTPLCLIIPDKKMKMVPVIKQAEKVVLFATFKPEAALLTSFGAIRTVSSMESLKHCIKDMMGVKIATCYQ
jgi:hypothetical protein